MRCISNQLRVPAIDLMYSKLDPPVASGPWAKVRNNIRFMISGPVDTEVRLLILAQIQEDTE